MQCVVCLRSVYPDKLPPIYACHSSSLSNALEEGTLDEELDYDETMETADLHLLEIEDAVEGTPVANNDPVGDGSNDDADCKEHEVLEEVYNSDD